MDPLQDLLKRASTGDRESLEQLFRELSRRGFGVSEAFYFGEVYVVSSREGSSSDRVYLSREGAEKEKEETERLTAEMTFGTSARTPRVLTLEDFIWEARSEARYEGIEEGYRDGTESE